MRGLVRAAVAALVLAGAATALAQPRGGRAPEAVRRAVIAELQGVRSEHMEAGDPRLRRPPNPDRMLSRIDVNGDGLVDWRVDYERAEWPGGWCGTGGCRQQLWVSRRGGPPTLAFDSQAFRFAFRAVGGERRMQVSVHGTNCNGYGTTPCSYAFAWDARARALRERVNFDSHGRLWSGGLAFEPQAQPPAPVAAARATIGACPSQPELSVPAQETVDLNDDGVRDWIVGAPYSCAGRALETRVMTSRAGGWEVAWSGADVVLYVDIAGSPPVVAVLNPADACSLGSSLACRETRLRWDARARRFTPQAD